MRKSSWICLLQIATLLILAVSSVAASGDNLTAHFLDVGQGDSILLQFAGKNILVDGGEQDMGPRVSSYLKAHGVSSLDLVVATHPHSDHIGGLINILKNFKVRQVLDSGEPYTSQTYETFLNLIDQKSILYKAAERGQIINLDPGIRIEVLSPPKKHFKEDINQNSVVLKITYKKISVLSMGDAGKMAEKSLLSSRYDLHADILKVGHHGSSDSSSSAFLREVNPKISVIEVGKDNDYGHPHTETIRALGKIGSKIYRTDQDGSIDITTDGTSFSISTQKAQNIASVAPQEQTSITSGLSAILKAISNVISQKEGSK